MWQSLCGITVLTSLYAKTGSKSVRRWCGFQCWNSSFWTKQRKSRQRKQHWAEMGVIRLVTVVVTRSSWRYRAMLPSVLFPCSLSTVILSKEARLQCGRIPNTDAERGLCIPCLNWDLARVGSSYAPAPSLPSADPAQTLLARFGGLWQLQASAGLSEDSWATHYHCTEKMGKLLLCKDWRRMCFYKCVKAEVLMLCWSLAFKFKHSTATNAGKSVWGKPGYLTAFV